MRLRVFPGSPGFPLSGIRLSPLKPAARWWRFPEDAEVLAPGPRGRAQRGGGRGGAESAAPEVTKRRPVRRRRSENEDFGG